MKHTDLLKPILVGAAAAVTGLALSISTATAQSPEEFYSENDVTLIVGAAAGGSTDRIARLVAEYLSKYIPGNPDVIVQNQPGAGGLVAATDLQHNAPKDGTVIAAHLRNNYVDPILSEATVAFDPREVRSLGSVAKNLSALYTYGDDPISLEQAREQEVILSATGAGSGTVIMPRMLNELVGTNFRVVLGYDGVEQELLAIERGEAQGRSPGYTTTKSGTQQQWLEEGKLHYMVVFARERLDEIPDVPSVYEFVDDPESVAILNLVTAVDEFGRPYIAPAGVPEDRLAVLREAMALTAADPQFIERLASQEGVEVDFVPGEEIEAMAEELMATPADLIERVKEIRSGD